MYGFLSVVLSQAFDFFCNELSTSEKMHIYYSRTSGARTGLVNENSFQSKVVPAIRGKFLYL